MNIRDLKYLVALADTHHFSRAAERCFISQPTLSAQIKKMESDLGVQLFERNNKHVWTTPIGEQLVQQARHVLWEWEQLNNLARHAHDPLAGVFRLGIIPTVSTYLLPHLLMPLKQQLPQIDLLIRENQTAVVLEDIKNGRLDAAIIALPIASPNLQVVELYAEPFYVALPTDHKLLTQSTVQLDQLSEENLLLLAEGHCLRDQALEACELQQNQNAPSDFTATSLETIKHLVAAGIGITLLPGLAALSLLPQLQIKPFAEPMPARQIGMVWRASTARKTVCEYITQLIKQQYQSLVLPFMPAQLKTMHQVLHP